MKNQKQILFFIGFLFFCQIVYAQETTSRFSGNLQSDASFFMRDSAIGAFNTPQYDRQLYGANSWLQLNYSNWGFDLGLRFDLFNNSNLLNPTGSYTAQGIGRWFIKWYHLSCIRTTSTGLGQRALWSEIELLFDR